MRTHASPAHDAPSIFSPQPRREPLRRILALVFRAAVIAALFCVGVSSRALAQNDEVERLIAQGIQAREQGDPERAVALFRQAHELSPSGRTHAQLGLALREQGNATDAYPHLAAAVRDRSEWIESNRGILEEQLAIVTGQVTRIDLRNGIPGSRVAIDGRPVGVLPIPFPFAVSPGNLVLTVTPPDCPALTRTLTASPGALLRESLPTECTAQESLPTDAPDFNRERPETPTAPVHVDTSERRRITPWAWVTLGAGVGSLLFTTWSFQHWRDNANRWNSIQCQSFDETRAELCSNNRDQAKLGRALTITGGTLSLGLLVTSVTLMVTSRRGGETASPGAFRLRITDGPGQAGLGLGADF